MNSAGKPARTRYRVLYGDVDTMGVVYYGNYFRLFERGRAEFMRDRGVTYKEFEGHGVLMPVTKAYCHYHKSAYYDDLLLIETRVGRIKRASVLFEYEIFREAQNRERLISGHTLHACLSPEGKVIRLPEFLAQVLNGQGRKI